MNTLDANKEFSQCSTFDLCSLCFVDAHDHFGLLFLSSRVSSTLQLLNRTRAQLEAN